MEITSVTLYAIIVIASLLTYLCKRQHSYWKVRGIPHQDPVFLYGNMKDLHKTKNLATIFGEVYSKFKGTGLFAGFYFFLKPAVLVLDLDLVQKILIKDFSYFDDRGLFYNEKDDPLTAHLFALNGVKWKNLRTKLSPTFTSGKMKLMFPTIVSVGSVFTKVVGQDIKNNPVIEIKDLMARFTTDVIGTCAFGIDCNSLTDPKAKFWSVGRKVFSERRHTQIVNGFLLSYPELAAKLRMRMFPDCIHDFYTSLVYETVEYREKNNVKKSDFMNLLIELKNNKIIKSESGEELTALTITEVAAQAFLFFLAGFETSSTTMQFCLYELALNQDIQDRVRKEVNEVFHRHNGEFTYECLKEMRYLDQTICETLRKYSVLSRLMRRANRDYATSDPKYVIEKGTPIVIPVHAIHHDPEYYPNPDVFDPDRFTPEEIEKRHPVAWLPFGDGPRNCIGLRFGKMQMIVGLSFLLREFKFTPSKETDIPLVFDVMNVTLNTATGIYLKCERI